MQAIGHEIKRRTPQSAICYVSSEKFTNEMINSLRYDKMISFRDKFRTMDVLLIDDIQFLAQKERTILQKKAEQERVTLPVDVALFIASNIRSNVRELEGALIRLVAHSSLIGATITLPYTQQVLKNFIDSQARKVTIESIQKAVAEQFGLRLVEIKSKNNSRSIVYPRQIAMYLAKHLTEASLPEIGRQFGGKHHTTVLHSVDKIEEVRKSDKDLNRLLNKMTEQLSA
jgi:chromosomal replication initiator protein